MLSFRRVAGKESWKVAGLKTARAVTSWRGFNGAAFSSIKLRLVLHLNFQPWALSEIYTRTMSILLHCPCNPRNLRNSTYSAFLIRYPKRSDAI